MNIQNLRSIILCCLLGASALCFTIGAANAASEKVSGAQSPAQALDAVQHALDTGDVALFEQHVDMDAIVGAAVDFFLADAQSPEGKARLSPVVAMVISSVSSSEDAQQGLRSLIGREARNFIVYGVQSGNFAGQSRANVPPPDGLLAPLFADASLGRKEIQRKTAPLADGKDALISFSVHDYGNGRSYPVTGRMRMVNAQWRLVQVENLPDLADQLRRESVE